MLLKFDLFDTDRDTRSVWINPETVAAVVEANRRTTYGGYNDVADIRLADGTVYTVYDTSRKVARQINEASAAQDGGPTAPPG